MSLTLLTLRENPTLSMYVLLVAVRSQQPLSLQTLQDPTHPNLGPAGLAAAIQLKKLANQAGNDDFRVLLLEKGSEIGDHIVSGNVLEPTALNELFPDWLSEDNPSRFEQVTPAKSDKMRFLTEKYAIPLPPPPQMNNH